VLDPLESRLPPLLLIGVMAAGWACDSAEPPPPATPSPPATVSEAPSPKPTEAMPEQTPHFEVSDKVVTTVSGKGEGPYRFTAPWHTKVMGNWAKVLGEGAGKPDLRYLEIGVFEGRSMFWMFEHVLTDPSSTATAVDIFMDEYEKTFDANVEASGFGGRIEKIKAPSAEALRAMSETRFDIIYIDGSHTADDVLTDAVLSWDLLEPGGLMIFDDYGWKGRPEGGSLPVELRPRMSIDVFLTAHRAEIELVHRDYQVMVRKVANPCEPKDYCTPIGQYQYYWRSFELRSGEGTKVELNPDETRMIEGLVLSRKIGQTDYPVPKEIRESPQFKAMVERLDLDLPRAQ
jgi:predicted O-methyltransferase YrrM